MNLRNLLPVAAAVALVAPAAAFAAAPALIPVTGYLTASDGTPLDGPTDIEFKIYRGTSVVWSNNNAPMTVDVDQGQFTAYLGEDATLDLVMFRDSTTPLTLGMAVDGASEMAPRLQLGSAPFAGYAEYSGDAATVGDHPADDFRLTSDDILWSDIDPTTLPTGIANGDDVGPTYIAGLGIAIAPNGTNQQISADQTAIEGWARAIAYDSPTELRSALDSVYLAKMTCSTNQVLMYDGTGNWTCTDTTALPLSETVIDGYVNNNGYATASALTTLTGRVTTAEGSITTLQGNVSTINSSLSTLQTQVGSLAGNPGNMLAQWELNEGSGTSFTDTSGLGNTLTGDVGGVGVGSAGHSGLSVAFFASRGLYAASGNKIADSAQIDAEMWMTTSNPGTTSTLLEKQGAYRMRMVGSRIEWMVTTTGGTCTVTHTAPIAINTWYKVQGAFDGLSAAIVVNGSVVAVPCTSGTIASTLGSPFTIGGKLTGASTWSEQFTGNIDEVRLRPTSGVEGGYYLVGQDLPRLASSTGGTISTSGSYRIHTFTSSGTFTAAGTGTVEVLVVAGGGSGGIHNTTNGNGGGGGGGVIYYKNWPITAAGAITVTVGAGGAAVSGVSPGQDGQDSVFGTLRAFGGGGGASSGVAAAGRPGGSGGGGARDNGGGQIATAPGYPTQPRVGLDASHYGNLGGGGDRAWTGAGGGGAGGPGNNGFSESDKCCGGNGGRGIASDISGTLAYYGGGGGGGGNSSERSGDGYDGGGRGFGTTSYYAYNSYPTGVNNATHGSSFIDALANTGGGGGAGSYWMNNVAPFNSTGVRSGAGGSGIVIVRYIP